MSDRIPLLPTAQAIVIRDLRAENERLRTLLWSHHGHSGAAQYGDNGELQCREFPYCDFKRDAIERIEEHLNPLFAAVKRTGGQPLPGFTD